MIPIGARVYGLQFTLPSSLPDYSSPDCWGEVAGRYAIRRHRLMRFKDDRLHSPCGSGCFMPMSLLGAPPAKATDKVILLRNLKSFHLVGRSCVEIW